MSQSPFTLGPKSTGTGFPGNGDSEQDCGWFSYVPSLVFRLIWTRKATTAYKDWNAGSQFCARTGQRVTYSINILPPPLAQRKSTLLLGPRPLLSIALFFCLFV